MRMNEQTQEDNSNHFNSNHNNNNSDNKKEETDSTKKNIEIDESLFECPLCSCLLFKPITTSCGHTFCQSCALRIMDHDNKCPLCRTVLHITPDYKISILLDEVIQKNFPERYQQRKQEIEKELNEQRFHLPLFRLGDLVLFPKMHLPLHVFEPRYRLMVRRCLEGCRSFGIVPTLNGDLQTIGCVATIENHYVFPDGRNLISTVGGQRFKVIKTSEMDGYTVAKVEYLPEDNCVDGPKFHELNEEYKKAKKLTEERLSHALRDLEDKFGPIPQNPIGFTWWMVSVLPLSAQEKYNILCMESPLDRLARVSEFLQMNNSSCSIS